MSDPLTWVRAIHYASLIQILGVFAFLLFIAEPAFAGGGELEARTGDKLHRLLLCLAWVSLAVVLVSGALWLVLVTAEMSGQPLGRILPDGIISEVMTRTDFGHVWELRLVMAGILTGYLLLFPRPKHGRPHTISHSAGLFLSAANLGALAWVGHARDTAGFPGSIHLSADVIHLLAAGVWLGGLAPLALLFSTAIRDHELALATATRSATLRFSTLGITSVAALFLSGTVNAWFLVGSISNLLRTEYGRLLTIKVGLFIAMIGIAAVNKFRLTPSLLERSPDAEIWRAVQRLRRNSLIEVGLGLVLLVIVGTLGISMPAIDAMTNVMP